MRKLTKDEWLKEMPDLIYKLKKNYGFYYSGCFRISKDILEITKNKKHKHKIIRADGYQIVVVHIVIKATAIQKE